ncbi:MAG: hypothetical protein QNJ44_09050 [Rhodobacter sp.]|nr:hypothetical protein [Rhodobacter sp.]
MVSDDTISARSERLAKLMEDRLGIGGRGLEAKLRKAGRRLPKWVQRSAAQLVEAERKLGHPKLAMQIDPAGLDRAYQQCERYLKDIDPMDRHKDRVLGFLAVNAVNLGLLGLGLLVVLKAGGHL